MDALEHDRVFAAVSHLPHLLAFALVAQIAREDDAERKLGKAGAGFRDFTRIAASSPTMWRDVCIANREALIAELGGYRALLVNCKPHSNQGTARRSRKSSTSPPTAAAPTPRASTPSSPRCP